MAWTSTPPASATPKPTTASTCNPRNIKVISRHVWPSRNTRDWPLGDVWNEAYRRSNVPEGLHWLTEVKRYETDVLSKR